MAQSENDRSRSPAPLPQEPVDPSPAPRPDAAPPVPPEVLAVPAAFTKVTGEAHWHVLTRARAIENGCYVVAPCQYGTLPGGAACFGHSLIVDPWGAVLADGGDGEGVVLAEIDLAEVRRARGRVPALSHDRPFQIRPETGRSGTLEQA